MVVSASSSSSNVRVVSFGHSLASSFVVSVSPDGETSIAGFVLEESVIAIEELRLRERGKGVSLDLPDTFKTSSSSESPARTALTLILNGGDGSSSDPVNGGSGLKSGDGGRDLSVFRVGLGSTEEFLVFSRSPGGHLVVAEFVRGLSDVVLVDEAVHALEVSKSEVVLFNGSIRESELSNMTKEVNVSRGDGGGKGGSEQFHLLSNIIKSDNRHY